MGNFHINKPCIFIVSGGRTATRYLAELLSVAVKDCYSVQEPDVLRVDDTKEALFRKIRDYGLINMTIGKFTAEGNPRRLSLTRQQNRIDKDQTAAILYKIRFPFISRLKEKIYAESNLQLVGLMDIIPLVFPNSRIAFIIRDGRHWVRSWLNAEFPLYSPKDPFYFLKPSRPAANMFPDDPFCHRWKSFSQFQKICWLWRFHIEYALKSMENQAVKIVKYEDLFQSDRQNEAINDLLKHLTAFPDGYQAEYHYNGELAGVKFHESKNNHFPKWDGWTSDQVREFQEICGDLSTRLGYGTEPLWQKMTTSHLNPRASHITFFTGLNKNTKLIDEASRRKKAEKILAVLDDYAGRNSLALDHMSCLDIGCSSGLITKHLGGRFRAVTGVDPDATAVGMARGSTAMGTVRYVIADGAHTPFPPAQFDVIICNQIYEHVPDAEALFREIFRLLKVGGICYLGARNKYMVMEPHYKLPFLSWLPPFLADWYLQKTRGVDRYVEKHYSLGQLKKSLTGLFRIVDYTVRVLKNPRQYHSDDMVGNGSIVNQIPATALHLALPLIPGYIFVLVKEKSAHFGTPVTGKCS